MEIAVNPEVLWNIVLTIVILPLGFLMRSILGEQKRLDILINKKREEILNLLEPFSDDEMKRRIDECNNFLNLINADCNSAVAVDYKDEVLQAEVYGKNEYIKFSALNAEEAFIRFKELDGLRLLNEHS